MNKFKFHGVGQGLFYTGSLMHGTYNFVFDCGTESKQYYVENEIVQYVNELNGNSKTKPHIDFVAVSHLHKDHISGIYDLLTKCKVDKLYLPYLMGDDTFKRFALAYISFYNSEDRDGENRETGYTLYNRLKSLYGIEEGRLGFETQIEFVGENYADKPIEFSVGNARNEYWKFKIFHRSLNKRIVCDLNSQIKSLMQSCGYSKFGDDEIIDFILNSEDAIDELANKYNYIFGKKNKYGLHGGLNISSLVLAHYPLYNGAKAYYRGKRNYEIVNEYYYGFKGVCCYPSDIELCHSYRTLTVLTGDAVLDSNFNQAWQFFDVDANKNKILFLHVPHHGALENWLHIKNLNLNPIGYILSFGLGNRHKHPHTQTVYDLNNKLYYEVTQGQSFEYIID